MKNSKLTLKWPHLIFPFMAVLGAIYIAKRGFQFGQWLYEVLH
ncbi:hypothetical protein [Flavobacterium sp.]